ncbi:MAG: M48 family metallopeptidase [Sedimentisphaerales bacterium]|nr:M48 family metallopeptidase [Sedimentisphaerales bacterium]
MSITIIDFPPLGSVVFSQSKRAKRMSILIRPFKPVRVAFPQRASLGKAKKYLRKNLGWAKESLDYVRKIEKEHEATLNSKPKLPKTKAKMILKNRLKELANMHGFKYNKVFIKNQKTRWGSCSNLNNINLNINLVTLTEELTDYVILHELVHTEIKNHSKKFWARLNKYAGGRAKELDKSLMKHKLGL